jgi:hypothetical protein
MPVNWKGMVVTAVDAQTRRDVSFYVDRCDDGRVQLLVKYGKYDDNYELTFYFEPDCAIALSGALLSTALHEHGTAETDRLLASVRNLLADNATR